MCNDKSNDYLLREAIENFCKETPGSKEWHSAFAKLKLLVLYLLSFESNIQKYLGQKLLV
ncbi:MAG: hypothetical protein F6K08_27785 [Okeania sp. SIO1H6]|nr:hypothetical protein [Okeania sp. SIO1H6]